MGYTHYWYTRKDGIPVSAWEKICADVRKLLSNLPAHSTNAGGYHANDPLELAFESDQPDNPPEVSASLIRFNGKGGNADLGHETFYFEPKPEPQDYENKDAKEVFVCCKTARKPYDLVVCGVLIVAAKHAGKYIRVSSDGDLQEWMPAFEWVVSVLGPEYAASAVAARLTGEFELGGIPEDAPDPPDPEPLAYQDSADVPRETPEYWNKPCASDGLISYRYPSSFGWVMIGAKDHADAIREANRSITSAAAELGKLEIWSDVDAAYVAAVPEVTPEPEPEPVTTSSTIVVDVKELRAALDLAVTEKKTTIPVLNEVCLQPHGSCLHILSTDLDKWTVTEVPAMIEDGTATFLMPHRKTLELLKGETGILRITVKVTTLANKYSHTWLRLEVGGCEYDIPAMNPANFPVCPDIPEAAFTVPGADLKASLGRIMVAISHEDSRYSINGALFECGKDKLLLVATDGHRLALDSVGVSAIPDGKALISRNALAWIYKQAAGAVDVTLGAIDSCFRVVDAHTVFIARNVTGQFPNYQAVMPLSDATNLTATFPSGDELAKTLVKVARMADERSGAVKFRINGACVLSASSSDTGAASATVKASITHTEDNPEIVAGFNSAYVLDALKVAGKNPVVLSLKDNQSAGVITVPSLPQYQYVLMPMRI